MPNPIERLINQLTRLNIRSLSPMRVNQTKKRKRSPNRRPANKSPKRTKR